MGVGGGAVSSVGANASKANSKSKETVLTTLTGAKVNVDVEEHTDLKGATIASVDENGNDNKQLNFSTGTITTSSLNDTTNSQSISGGITAGLTSSKQADGSKDIDGVSNVSLDYTNDTTNKKTKVLATLGEGQISIGNKEDSDTKMLNRDIANNEVDIYDVESHKGLKAEIDTRVFTEDGRNQIKKEARDAYEHGEDIGKTVHTVATDEKIGIENILDAAQDNFASTKTKNFLTDTAEGQKIAEGLKADPNSQEYQEAKAEVVKVYQNIRGIEESEVVHYDAKTTEQDVLKDVNGVDVQGATLTKGDNVGTILLDTSGDANGNSNKQQDMFVAGHEIGETKYLQNGNGVIFEDSYDTKEAMNDALGSSLTNRVNQATDGAITSTTYTTSSNDYVQTQTASVNNLTIQNDGIEYRQLTNNEIEILQDTDNIEKFKEYHNSVSDDKINNATAQRILAQGGASLVDTENNEIYGSDKSGKGYNASVDIAKSFIEDELKDQSKLDSYVTTTGEIKTTHQFAPDEEEKNDHGANIRGYADNKEFYETNLNIDKPDESSNVEYVNGAINSVEKTVDAIVDSNGKVIVDSTVELIKHPIDTFVEQGEELRGTYEEASLYELQGENAKAKQLQGEIGLEVGSLAAEGAALTKIAGKGKTPSVDASKINTNELGLGDVKSPNPDVEIKPGQDVLLSQNDGLEVRLPNEGKFENVVADGKTTHLFSIDNNGLKVIDEKTPVGGNDVAKHTNLSDKAAFAGEVKFNPDGSVTINPYSGRFGVGNSANNAETITKLDSTKKYFESLGYDVKVEFEPKATSNTVVTDSIVNGKDSAKNVVNYEKYKQKLTIKEKTSQLNADTSTVSGQIANGHAWEKHKSDFPTFETSKELQEHIDTIITNPSNKKDLTNGRTAYWDDNSQTAIIIDPNHPDGGTVMKPTAGKKYYDNME